MTRERFTAVQVPQKAQLVPLTLSSFRSPLSRAESLREYWRRGRFYIPPSCPPPGHKRQRKLRYPVDLISHVASNADRPAEVSSATIDLRKAFDLIDHVIPIKKMISLGSEEAPLKWISSSLLPRNSSRRPDLRLHYRGLRNRPRPSVKPNND